MSISKHIEAHEALNVSDGANIAAVVRDLRASGALSGSKPVIRELHPDGIVADGGTGNIVATHTAYPNMPALKTGTAAAAATTNKLEVVGATFTTDGTHVGSLVINTTANTYTFVKAIDSDTILSLANDRFTVGSEGFIVSNARIQPIGYGGPDANISTSGFRVDPNVDTGSFNGVNVTSSYDLVTKTDATRRFSFIHRGQFLSLEGSITSNDIWVKVDDKYLSLDSEISTDLFKNYDFGSVAERRIDIIAGGALKQKHIYKSIYVGATDTLRAAPVRGPTVVMMAGSYFQNPYSGALAFGEAIRSDDVIGSGVGSTGFVKTGATAGTAPSFGMRLQTDVIDLNPDIVIIPGTINDNGYTYAEVYDAATLVFADLRAGLPNAVVMVGHTSPFGPDGEVANSCRARSALKAATIDAGYIWRDPTEQPVVKSYTTTAAATAAIGQKWITTTTSNPTNAAGGFQGNTIMMDADSANLETATEQRRTVTFTENSGGSRRIYFDTGLTFAVTAGDTITVVGNSYMVGTGTSGAPTGFGNSEVLADGVHPTNAGHDALGAALASLFIDAVIELEQATTDSFLVV